MNEWINVHAPTEDKINYIKYSFYKELEHVFNKLPKYHLKILLGGFSTKVNREDIFKPTIGNESLHEIINDNRIRVVNIATYKNHIVKSTELPHYSVHKCNWMAPDGKTHNQINHFRTD
jgi:hypothetical protein